jgi:heat shock protein HtpX
MGNNFKTILLLGLMTGLFILGGDLLGGRQGMMIALVMAAVMNIGSYFFSDKIALAAYRAQPVTERELPEVYDIVRGLVERNNLVMPRIYLIPSPSPNAFATGRNPQNAVVAVTEGLLRILDREELEGVLAHELAHVQNRDILIQSIAATVAGALTMLARMFYFTGGRRSSNRANSLGAIGGILFLVLAPIASMLVQMAISRAREFQADATGAQLAGNPYGLARALEKLERGTTQIPMHDANPATAHMMIVNPLRGGGLMSLFRTHPPTQDRIQQLIGYVPESLSQ